MVSRTVAAGAAPNSSTGSAPSLPASDCRACTRRPRKTSVPTAGQAKRRVDRRPGSQSGDSSAGGQPQQRTINVFSCFHSFILKGTGGAPIQASRSGARAHGGGAGSLAQLYPGLPGRARPLVPQFGVVLRRPALVPCVPIFAPPRLVPAGVRTKRRGGTSLGIPRDVRNSEATSPTPLGTVRARPRSRLVSGCVQPSSCTHPGS